MPKRFIEDGVEDWVDHRACVAEPGHQVHDAWSDGALVTDTWHQVQHEERRPKDHKCKKHYAQYLSREPEIKTRMIGLFEIVSENEATSFLPTLVAFCSRRMILPCLELVLLKTLLFLLWWDRTTAGEVPVEPEGVFPEEAEPFWRTVPVLRNRPAFVLLDPVDPVRSHDTYDCTKMPGLQLINNVVRN